MSDLISRKALMKYMRDYKWEFALNSDFSKAIEMVDVQPAVELPTWIPCSERLPDIKEGEYASDCVLVTLKWWDGEISETVGWYNRTGTWSEDGKMSKVIAWMPYEPYKGE